MFLLLLLGFWAVLPSPSLQKDYILGKGEACGGWAWGRCDSSLNLTCVTPAGTEPGTESSEPTGVCTPGPAPGCAPCSSVICPPRRLACPGSHVTDPCGCCSHCARQEGQLCGGPNWEKGYCDRTLTCTQIEGLNSALPPETGVCKVCPWIERYHMSDPLCPWRWGCKVRMSHCDCFSIQSCHDIYSYSEPEPCWKTMMADRMGPEGDDDTPWECTTWGCELREDHCECLEKSCSSPTHRLSRDACDDLLVKVPCSNTSCPEVPAPSCPADSFLTEPYTPPGQCCPLLAAMCTCRFKKCPLAPPTCPPGQHSQLREKGNGHPGSCCDQYQCLEAELRKRGEE